MIKELFSPVLYSNDIILRSCTLPQIDFTPLFSALSIQIILYGCFWWSKDTPSSLREVCKLKTKPNCLYFYVEGILILCDRVPNILSLLTDLQCQCVECSSKTVGQWRDAVTLSYQTCWNGPSIWKEICFKTWFLSILDQSTRIPCACARHNIFYYHRRWSSTQSSLR